MIVSLSVLLCLRFHHFFQERLEYHDGQTVVIESVLQEDPELSNRGQRFSVKDGYNQTIYVTADAFPRWQYGQVLRIEGKLQERELEDGMILYSLYYPQIEVKLQEVHLVAGWANAIRERSKIVFESVLPPVSASLLMGIVFGAKEEFPDAFFDALQTTGVLHVIAASGMNVTFVSAALLFGLGSFLRRQYALISGCFGIVFYVFLVGFEPSIVRASIMGVLAFGASLLGRQHIAAYALLVSAYVMLFMQPGFLFDLGFQLSFLATLGIIFVKPVLEGGIGGIGGIGRFFLETVTTTAAAQIGTLPLLLGTFGQIGVLSLLVNALVLWVVPIVMLIGSVASIVGLLIAPLAQMLVYIALPFLLFFEYVVSLFGQNGLVMHMKEVPVFVWIGYYIVLVALVMGAKPKLSEQKKSLLSDL